MAENTRKFINYSLGLLLLAFLISCSRQTPSAKELIDRAEKSIEQEPDSALDALNSIFYPEKLNRRMFSKYCLLLVQAKDKLYKDITSDTVIFDVRDYYEKRNEVENIALSSFYCGRVLQEQRQRDAAMAEYLKADEYAEKTKNINLRGLSQSLIGEVLLKELLQTEAIEHFQIAVQHFHKAKNLKNEIISYSLIGSAFLMKSFNDSAFYYYNKGLELAEANNDSLQITRLIHNIGIAYRETGKYDLAEKYFRKATEYITNSDDKIKLYLNLSKTFYEREILDSAKVYVNKSLSLFPDNNDIFVAADIYKTLSQIAEKQSEFKQSLGYYKEYADNLRKIVSENKSNEILELQKRYNYERLQNENNKLKINKQKIYILFSITLLIVCLLVLFFYKKFADNKKIALEKDNQILEAKSQIYLLMEMGENYSSEINSLRDCLLHHFDILKKVTLLKQYLRDNDEHSHRLVKKFNEIVYGQESLNWGMLYKDMDKIHKGLLSRLKERYPVLDETEFRICCLTCADLSCSEIAFFMELKPNTIQMKRTSIRKKLGIEPQGNIRTHLETLLKL
jgi:tetratricopeptide (TPR) repeat protein/DNA-binding CsgD family transcriptional regulator